jgi:prepilin-type N-terminal cleavage/methylation domain-containing protein
MNLSKDKHGFTIVELLIVIVVIGILAAITIVAFNGVTKNAKAASVKSDVANNVKLLESYKITNSEQYPATAAAASLKSSSDNMLSYLYNANSNTYCVQVQNSGITYASSGLAATEGDCGATGIVAWWKLNGNANDDAGSNTGTITNATATAGQNDAVNGAYAFNGSNTAIITKSFDITGSITVSAWVKPSNTTQGSKILGKHSGASNVQGTIADTGGYAQFEITAGGSYYSAYTTAGGQLPAGAWSLVTGVYDRNTAAIYVNGTYVTSVPAAGAIATNTLPWTIGALPSNSGNFTGSIDDARIYNRALTAAEVTMLYNKGAQ